MEVGNRLKYLTKFLNSDIPFLVRESSDECPYSNNIKKALIFLRKRNRNIPLIQLYILRQRFLRRKLSRRDIEAGDSGRGM